MDLSKRAEPLHREVRQWHLDDVEVRRDDGYVARFRGVATAFDKPYTVRDAFGEFEETVEAGAATKTLSESPDVVFLTNHGGLTMARTTSGTLRLDAVKKGLAVDADLDTRRSDVDNLALALERKDVDEMSFAFRVVRQEWNEDYTERWIKEFDIHRGDVSAVNFGANPHTSAALRALGEGFGDLDSALTAIRSGEFDPGQLDLAARAQQAIAELVDSVRRGDLDARDAEALMHARLTFNRNRLQLTA
jgi:HK97 family phage prohead protease